MRISHSKHSINPYLKYSPKNDKEERVTKKRKVLLARLVRTLTATVVGLVAAWLSGPEGLSLVKDPAAQSFVVAVVIPTLITIDKMLRYGKDEDDL